MCGNRRHLKQVPGPAGNLALCQGQLVFRDQLSGVDKLGLLNLITVLRFFFLFYFICIYTLVSQHRAMGLFGFAFV